MNTRGYLYVLANSSLQGLVKVGKTSRQPSLRAQELSGVTGIPTPFIVVYEQLFEDCDAAEEFVHTMLEQQGYRISENREFFKAPTSDVVRLVMRAPGAIIQDAASHKEAISDETLLSSHPPDELDSMVLPDSKRSLPWIDLWEEAERYHNGFDDYLEDHREAIRLYKEAAKLGCLIAYDQIGYMYRYGEGVREDKNLALDYFKEGARKGNYYCYLSMSDLFLITNQENHDKCTRLFFQNRLKQVDSTLESFISFPRKCLEHIIKAFLWGKQPSKELLNQDIRNAKEEMITYCERDIKHNKEEREKINQDDLESHNNILNALMMALEWIQRL